MFELAKVTAVYPEHPSADISMLDTGWNISGVPIASGGMCSSNSGLSDFPAPEVGREILAIVGYVSGQPIIMGFVFPQASACLFADKNRMVYRHASDVYMTIDSSGNTELYHPSGTFLRIGESAAHEDLTGKDYDGLWKIANNTGRAVHVALTVANAGSTVASLDIDPGGNVTASNTGNLSATVGGTTTIDSAGDAEITAPNITLNGNVFINGPLSQGEGTNGGGATMLGPLYVTNDVTAGPISLMNHTHTEQGDGNDVSLPH